MQRNYRFEIISVSREENSLSCSTEWDKSGYFTPSNLLPKSIVKMKHLTREQRYGLSLMLQEGKSRKDIATKNAQIQELLEYFNEETLLEYSERSQLRAWLKENHSKEKECWGSY